MEAATGIEELAEQKARLQVRVVRVGDVVGTAAWGMGNVMCWWAVLV